MKRQINQYGYEIGFLGFSVDKKFSNFRYPLTFNTKIKDYFKKEFLFYLFEKKKLLPFLLF
jgi:hypothetical protein